ncbi:DUF3060 domain-containing protein [Deinococcus detaillensis]|uniref:DUF3060 domain-containing protein n=1 Tax=Deinococcus detaillensis TaxID=2592048 RepID=A0A553V4X9_9DEIO|nr:DUF3060 domain-containing protein [Deinococcus detaillensis]TSA87519.1 DUF3060 domain-containing protein [Deinococcus detaillensis]
MNKLIRAAVFASLSFSVSAQTVDMSTLNISGMGRIVAGDQTKQTLACKNDSVSVAGDGNTIILTGNCTQVIIAGSKNKVSMSVVGEIVLSGDGNTVTWHKALKGTKPRMLLTGKANTVSKK